MAFLHLIADHVRFGCCQCASYVYFWIEVLHDHLIFAIYIFALRLLNSTSHFNGDLIVCVCSSRLHFLEHILQRVIMFRPNSCCIAAER